MQDLILNKFCTVVLDFSSIKFKKIYCCRLRYDLIRNANKDFSLGQILLDSFETYKTFSRCIITEFECIVDVQNHEFGWVGFQNRFF